MIKVLILCECEELYSGQLYKKCIDAVVAFSPNFALVADDDTLGNGKSQTVALAEGPHLVDAIKTLEDIL